MTISPFAVRSENTGTNVISQGNLPAKNMLSASLRSLSIIAERDLVMTYPMSVCCPFMNATYGSAPF